MDKAIQVFSRDGNFNKVILAREIKSKEHARKLSPFVDPNNKDDLVTWVSPSFDNQNLKRRSHFRKRKFYSVEIKTIKDEENERRAICNESAEHKLAKELLSNELRLRIKNNIPLEWGFYDKEISDLPIIGNLLLAAESVEEEYTFKSSSGEKFRLDIAIMGKGVRNTAKKFIYAAIEIEKENQFEYRKEILCKSAAFPLISINISDLSLNDINEAWAKKIIGETLKSSPSSKRANFFYLHDLLYPLFLKYPDTLIKNEPEHQFILFDNSLSIENIKNYCLQLGKHIPNYKFHIHKIHIYNRKGNLIKEELKKYQNLANIVGIGCEEINSETVVLITIKRPESRNIQDFINHMALFRILLSSPTAMIGYRYARYETNNNFAEDLWIYKYLDAEKKELKTIKICPKRLSIPLEDILDIIRKLSKK